MQLYIIGNGFDLYHGLKTRYQEFAFFLQEHYSELYDYLIQYYGLPDLDRNNQDDHWNPLWADFEHALSGLDFETVLHDNTNLLPNIGSDDFRDRDWHSYQIQMEMIVDDLTKNLFAAFKKFILQVEYPSDVNDIRLHLHKEAYFLNFNYTLTLEKYYSIPKERILYIHNSAHTADANLILGHGADPQAFEEEEQKPPPGLTEEQLQEWYDYMSDQYDYAFESGKSELMAYFSKSFKHTSRIIEENRDFFSKIKNVKKITVIGHSLSPVDMPYISAVFNAVRKDAIWSASCYKESERAERHQKLLDLGVRSNKIRLFYTSELQQGFWKRMKAHWRRIN